MPDVLCLQEIKCEDATFPRDAFVPEPFAHLVMRGQKAYHGVCILSRFSLEPLPRLDLDQSGEARDIGATFTDGPLAGVDLYNLYVPAGGYTPDPVSNPKFAQKLRYVEALRTWGKSPPLRSRILLGDLNIAPLESDVYSHEKLRKVVSHTDIERKALVDAMEAGRWSDAVRRIVPLEQKLYSWWTYRYPDWDTADRGRRLDHVWVSDDLAPRVVAAKCERELRGWGEPSDHVPVIVDLACD